MLVLITAAWNMLRVWSSVRLAPELAHYSAYPGPVYIGVTGAVSALCAVGVAWGLWRRAIWAPSGLFIGALIYAAWIWIDRLVLQANPGQGCGFGAVVTLLLLGFTTAVGLDPRNRQYFGKEAHEREEQERPTA